MPNSPRAFYKGALAPLVQGHVADIIATMSRSRSEPRPHPDPTEAHWFEWAFFIVSIIVIVMVVLVGTSAKPPWMLALF